MNGDLILSQATRSISQFEQTIITAITDENLSQEEKTQALGNSLLMGVQIFREIERDRLLVEKEHGQKIEHLSEKIAKQKKAKKEMKAELEECKDKISEHEETISARDETISEVQQELTKIKANNQKKINTILDRAIAQYQGRGHGCVSGGTLSGVGMVASILTGPFAFAILPAMAVSATASAKGAEQEYGFEQKLRKAKKNGDFNDVDPEDLPKLILEMKKEHNKAMKKKWAEDSKKVNESCISSSESGDNYEISFNN